MVARFCVHCYDPLFGNDYLRRVSIPDFLHTNYLKGLELWTFRQRKMTSFCLIRSMNYVNVIK